MLEVTNSIKKLVKSLSATKNRRELGLFVAEGTKSVGDIAKIFTPKMLIATADWFGENADAARVNCDRYVAKKSDLERMSCLSTATSVIGVFSIPDYDFDLKTCETELVVALDRVQDPGNLGTIIRLCDWFGVKHILASAETVDVWNPKVIQSTMGSIARVKVHYVNLVEVLSSTSAPVYGTFLEGESLYKAPLTETGVIVMGNEGKGISADVARLVTKKILIPTFPEGSTGAESLNVATATAITVSEFRRRQR
jgi:TrmH family RNA methyltransferase